MIHIIANQGGRSGKGAAWGSSLETISTFGGQRTTETPLLPFEEWAEVRLVCASGAIVQLEGPAEELWRALVTAEHRLYQMLPAVNRRPYAEAQREAREAIEASKNPVEPAEVEAHEEPEPPPADARQVAFDAVTGEVLDVVQTAPTEPPPPYPMTGPEFELDGPEPPKQEPQPEPPKRGRRRMRIVEPEHRAEQTEGANSDE